MNVYCVDGKWRTVKNKNNENTIDVFNKNVCTREFTSVTGIKLYRGPVAPHY
jgi:hypothetical protein